LSSQRIQRIVAAVETLGGLAGDGERRPGAVRLTYEGSNAEIVLDNPGARNAMTVHMMADLGRCVADLLAGDVGLVTIHSSTSGIFCAGGHLGDVRESLNHPDAGRVMGECMSAILNELMDAPFLVVALVDGPAIGGGAEIATAADMRLISPAGYLHFVHGGLGVVPGWGGTARLIRHVGAGHGIRLLGLRERCGPALAEAIGLGVPVALEAGSARALARLSGMAPAVLRSLKGQLRCSRSISDPAREQRESAYFAGVWAGAAHAEALAKLKL
jgi:ethylmalonyl-CoA/methylmalonyl-CoA decarboxylase